jgi:quinol monooxygenase YgiN
MKIGRREFVAGTVALAALAPCASPAASRGTKMYGLIGKMSAAPGKRDALVAILLDGVGGMPGCLSYVVAEDPADPNAIWVTEVWKDKASHAASLALPSVKEAIRKGRPLIARFDQSTEITPVGGFGLSEATVL